MTLASDIETLEWVRNRAGVYHSVTAEDEPWFYMIERKGRRWIIYRIVRRNKKRAKSEELTDAATFKDACFVASCDYTEECIPLMEAARQ